jgi:hypothetical protein
MITLRKQHGLYYGTLGPEAPMISTSLEGLLAHFLPDRPAFQIEQAADVLDEILRDEEGQIHTGVESA